MKRVLLITSVILATVWAIGVHNMNSEQNRYIQIETLVDQEPIIIDEVPKEASSTPVIITSKNKIATSSPKITLNTAVNVVSPVTIPPATPEPAPDFGVINTFARKAVVNILCTVKNNEFSPISGTGVIISSTGVVLTNAHIAQYFLLKDLYVKDYITCVLRTGSPAYPKYNVELVYISPLWVNQNKSIIKIENPLGTGENDYAFLRITGMVDGSNLIDIPYLPPNPRELININEPVILVSYPAGFLGGLSILKDLSITSGVTTIKDYFTFKENTIDLISVPGTIVSQKGSSGGAVVDKNSSVIGIISTSSNGTTTGERELAAITLGYINRSLKNESGINLFNFLSGDVIAFAKKFQETEAPALTKMITDVLTKTN